MAAEVTRRRYIFRTPVIEIVAGPGAKRVATRNSKPNRMLPPTRLDFGKPSCAKNTVKRPRLGLQIRLFGGGGLGGTAPASDDPESARGCRFGIILLGY